VDGDELAIPVALLVLPLPDTAAAQPGGGHRWATEYGEVQYRLYYRQDRRYHRQERRAERRAWMRKREWQAARRAYRAGRRDAYYRRR
jgi:hypothetical protein